MNAPAPLTETHESAMAVLGLILRECDDLVAGGLQPPVSSVGTMTDLGLLLAMRHAAEAMQMTLRLPHTPDQEELIERQAILMGEALDLIEVEDPESW